MCQALSSCYGVGEGESLDTRVLRSTRVFAMYPSICTYGDFLEHLKKENINLPNQKLRHILQKALDAAIELGEDVAPKRIADYRKVLALMPLE